MFAVKDVTVRFGGRDVLSDVTLSLAPQQKVGLVGPNGVGKSTLLAVMAGIIQPTAGTVQCTGDETVTYVPQDYALVGDITVSDYLKRRSGLAGPEQVIDAFLASPSEDLETIQAFSDAQETWTALGGPDFDGSLETVFRQVGLPQSALVRRVDELSGGQQVKLGLAGILLARFDVQLLDEPTNNLDLRGITMLEEHIARSSAAMCIVSHDRRFLDRTVTGIAELDWHSHTLSYWGVGYEAYRQARATAKAAQSRAYQDYLDEVARLQEAIRRASTRVVQTGAARRDNDKLGANYRAGRGTASAAAAKQRAVRALERLPEVDQPAKRWDLRLELRAGTRSGQRVVTLDHCTVHYPGFKLGPVSLTIGRTDRVAIIGPNGSGKTTLVNLITNLIEPATGTLTKGKGVQFGRLDQDQRLTFGHETALAAFMHRSAVTDEGEARTLLSKFDLGADEVLRPAEQLSPGQRARLMLAALMAGQPNVLVLDEPTNHLDLEALEELEAALIGYEGTVIVVSHDREFLERIGVTTVLEVADGTVREGSYALRQ